MKECVVFYLYVMTKASSNLIEASAIREALKNKNTVVVDARSGPDAYTRYLSGHLEGAIHVDLDHDLSQKPMNPAIGGRHPLPDIKDFSRLLGKAGITPSSMVVVYDDKNGVNAAARFWWMLKAVGHEQVKVVNGGLQALVKENIPMTNTVAPAKTISSYNADRWKLPTMAIDEVAKAVTDPSFLVIDVREAYRFRGESEPIDLTAGHIPGAINIPYIENLDQEGKFVSSKALADRYKKEIGDRNTNHVVVHCGSGVTACHTLLALEEAGIKGAQLYVGSWSEWSRSGREVAKENNK